MKLFTLPVSQLLSLHSLIVVSGLLIYVLTTHAMHQRRAPTSAISWVLTIALIPYVGLPLYLLFGTRKLRHAGRHALAWQPEMELQSGEPWFRILAASMGQPPVAAYRSLRVHDNGAQALQALWELIDSAEHELVLSTFILARDPMGRELMQRLMAKAHAGVRIRLLIDGVGRLLGGGINLRRLRAAGMQVRLFGPILHVPFRSRTNLRNHRKLAVADGARLWCGGRNFAAEYFEGKPGRAPWQDASFDLQGPVALQALALFEQDWAHAGGKPGPHPDGGQAAKPGHGPGSCAQLIASGPDQADDTVHDLLISACFKAHSRILAATPYFVPTDRLLMALVLAARRGVIVDLVLPARSNHHMADFARHRALRTLAAAGGRIWQVPYMLHAKVVVIDDDLALAGSANLDGRSLLLNYELMMAFHAGDDVARFACFNEKHREAAKLYKASAPSLLRDFAEGLLLWVAFQL